MIRQKPTRVEQLRLVFTQGVVDNGSKRVKPGNSYKKKGKVLYNEPPC
jgi:hypothetical protein